MHEHNHDCECGCGCDHGCEQEEMTVTLLLDDDSELECHVLAIFPVAQRQYIALLPIEQIGAGEGEIFLYRYQEPENGELELSNIEDDEEYEMVADAFDELLEEEDLDEIFLGESKE